jgi:hypothetical protein
LRGDAFQRFPLSILQKQFILNKAAKQLREIWYNKDQNRQAKRGMQDEQTKRGVCVPIVG